MSRIFSLLAGWLLDLIFGDPAHLPHPIVGFGKLIAAGVDAITSNRAAAVRDELAK